MSTQDTPVNTLVNTPVNCNIDVNRTSVEQRILDFCVEPKGVLEIADYLGYKEKKSVRKYLSPLLELGRIAIDLEEN